MNNIKYKITEIENNIIDNDITDNDIIDIDNDLNILIFSTYSVKQLSYILQYYNISKGRMCKDEIIQSIVLFENDKNNINIVNKRKYLWTLITELKNDDFFNKYIVIDIK